jgi:quinoprotein glucose dehydrogenase
MPMAAIVTGWIMLVLGVLLAAGGVWLAVLGGSWVYIGLGIGWLATGWLLVLRRRAALTVYAVLLACTTIWALWEVGLDRWSLVPRCALFWLVALWLLVPWVSRSLGVWVGTRTPVRDMPARGLPARDASTNAPAQAAAPADVPTRASWRGARGWLAAVAVLVLIVGLLSLTRDPFDVAGELHGRVDAASAAAPDSPAEPGDDWAVYGGTGYGQRYSSLNDITPENVDHLRLAWTFHTQDKQGPNDPTETTAENVPLKVGDLLYLCTKHDHVVALDPATGEKRWEFDPKIEVSHDNQHLTCRGLLYHDATTAAPPITPTGTPASAADAAPAGSATTTEAAAATAASSPTTAAGVCARRIILPSIDARLFALDATSGQPCTGFGTDGIVNLAVNMGDMKPGYYMETSPPVVTRNLIVVGGSINDDESVINPSGVIRAFDVNDGHLVWSWDLGKADPNAALAPGEQYTANTPPAWAPPSVDEKLGLVYFPTGNQSPDQLGAGRSPAVQKFSSSVVALDLATGSLRWSFQGVHDDLWDRDMPAQPTLIDLDIGGATVPALVQPTKQGDVYVLDRRDGKPIQAVGEMAVPGSSVPGENAARTQPTSALTFMPPPLTGKDMWGATPFDQLICRIQFQSFGYDGPYTPPSTHKTLTYPANLGIFDWGGVAVDPVRQILIGLPVHMAYVFQLVPRPAPKTNVVTAGSNEHFTENYGAPYAVTMDPFLSPLGVPCQAPPWGALASADLRTGKIVWMHRNGTTRDRMPSFLPIGFKMGMPGFGGPLITASGVVFYSGSLDDYLRAYDETTGRKLWQARLPAGGQATPMTYRVNGKQFVVVSAGGHGSAGTPLGDAFVAYTLP